MTLETKHKRFRLEIFERHLEIHLSRCDRNEFKQKSAIASTDRNLT